LEGYRRTLKELDAAFTQTIEQENQGLLIKQNKQREGKKEGRLLQGEKLVQQNFSLESAKKQALEIDDYANDMHINMQSNTDTLKRSIANVSYK